jgi:hypothetical protein
VRVAFKWIEREAEYDNEVGLFIVDDQGRVNGIAPGDPEYAQAALNSGSRRVLFESGDQAGSFEELAFAAGTHIAFYIIKDSNTENFLANNPLNATDRGEEMPMAFFSVNGANSDGYDHVRSNHLGSGIWRMSWEDIMGGGDQDFDDVILNVEQLGIIVPGETGEETNLNIEILSEDSNTFHEFGYFLVDTPNGNIGNLQPGDAGYLQAAFTQGRYEAVIGSSGTYNIASGQYVGWYLISGGTSQDWLENNPDNRMDRDLPIAFVSYAQANPDGLHHSYHNSSNEIVWENTPGGGDLDYDDLVFRFQFGTPFAVENELIDSSEGAGGAEGAGEAGEAEPPVTDPPTPITDPPTDPSIDPPITDPPLPSLSINDVSLIEGDNGTTNAIFTVSLSQPSLNQVTVNYRTEALTALEDEDYQPINGRLTFAPSETTKTLTIAIVGDDIEELDETFTLVLSEAVNAVIEDELGLATILNDDNDDDEVEDPTNDPPSIPDIVLTEQENYLTTHQQTLTLPSTPSLLTFTYSQLNFDTTDSNRINDGFEVALLDNKGNSIVHTIGQSQDAFFNITEGNAPKYGQSVSIDGQTVTLDLSSIIGETEATLVFRLINNDTDSTSTVTITDIAVVESNLNNTNPLANTPLNTSSFTTIDFEKLENISNSIQTHYGRTSVNEDTQVLYTDLTLENLSHYPIKKQLIVAVTNLSDPNVSVVGIDGKTPQGLPYFDFSHLINEGSLDPNQTTQAKTISFYNPDKIQFTYDLVILGQLNQAPVWVSEPEKEIKVNQSYHYQLEATDADGDNLSYQLLASPQGLMLDESNQTLNWTPTEEQIGNHNIILEVKDGQGGSSQQSYTLGVFKDIPNRPPLITSTPEVDGFVNTNYRYQVIAKDIDGDDLSYYLIPLDNGSTLPNGMTINETSGLIEWTPNANQIGKHHFQVEVRDGQGNSTQQSIELNIKAESNNNAPVIISSAITQLYLDSDNYHYFYDVNALDPDKDLLTYTLVESPSEMTIDSNSGQINWQPTDQQIGTHQITVEVTDGRGGIDSQTFILEVLAIEGGVIQGTVWDDLNANGILDIKVLEGDNPDIFFVIDVSGSMGRSTVNWLTADVAEISSQRISPLDQELGAILALAEFTIAQGRGNDTQFGIITSGQSVIDMNPFEPGIQATTTALADNNNNGIIDIREAIDGPLGGGGSNADGIATAQKLHQALPGDLNIVFMSDGFISISKDNKDSIAGVKANGGNITAFGFDDDGMDKMREVDPDATYISNPQQIIDIFSGVDLRYTTEPLLEGVTVYLDLNNNGYLDFDEPQYISRIDDPDTLDIDETGQYEFTGLAPGTYTVGIVVPSSREQTYPKTPNQFSVTIKGGETSLNHNFGLTSIDEPIPNNNPSITSDVLKDLIVGQTLSHKITAIDENNDPLTFTLALSSEGMAIDPNTGILIWTPTAAQLGEHQVFVKVSDDLGGFDLQGFTIVVASENTAPVITSTPVTTVGSNVPYQYQIQAQDDPTQGLTYILDNAPDGMTLDGTRGLLTWQPTENQQGTHNVIKSPHQILKDSP